MSNKIKMAISFTFSPRNNKILRNKVNNYKTLKEVKENWSNRKDIPHSWIGRQYAKSATPKLVYIHNSISIKISHSSLNKLTRRYQLFVKNARNCCRNVKWD